jgi:putative oxidoreductase
MRGVTDMMWRTTARDALAWALCAVTAAIFLVAGIPKLTGGEYWVSVFAMWGYPAWFRTVVGVVETVGAIALLIPQASFYAAVALLLVTGGAIYTHLASGQPGAGIALLLFALLLLVAWTRRPAGFLGRAAAAAHDVVHDRISREGFIAGILGATTVAVWFLIIDTVTGRPLYTPMLLGRALFSVLGPTPVGDVARVIDSPTLLVAGYTLFHYAAFIAMGTIGAAMLNAAQRNPGVLAGFLILFVAFEIGFHALVALLQETTPLGALAWYQVMLGNLLASAAMAVYFWQAHPELRSELRQALDGTA